MLGGLHRAWVRGGGRRWAPAMVGVALLTGAALGAAIRPGLAVNAPTISATASPTTEVGLQIFANSNLGGGANPTGTITWDLFGPGDTSCTTPIFSSTVAVNGNGSYNSEPFTTAQAGTYRWRARYSGDVNNNPAGPTACNDPAATVVVAKASTVLTTVASGPIALGGQIHDTATLAGGLNPTGTITFFVYGPTDQFCSAPPLATSTATVNGNGTYRSADYTPPVPGVYKWRATYSGDDNNLGVSITACLDPNEASTVTAAAPTLVTSASGPTTVGGQLSDTAVLTGADNPTGTITFRLFGPDDPTCSGTVASQSSRTVNGNGTYTSDAFTAAAPGTYRWVASYSGDANNPALASACGDPAQTVVVSAGPTTTSTSTSTTSTSTTSTSTTTTSTTVPPTTTSTPSTTSTSSTTTSTTSPAPTTTSSSTTSSSTTSSTTTTLAPTTTSSTLAPTTTSSTLAPTTTSSTVVPTTTSTVPTTTSSTSTSSTSTTSTTVPVATGTTVAPAPAVTVTPNPVGAGQNAVVTGTGFPSGPADITLFSTPALLSRLSVGAGGTFTVTVTIPADTPPGAHRLVVTGSAGTVLAETAVTVTAAGAGTVAVAATVQPIPAARQLSRTGAGVSGLGGLALSALMVGVLAVIFTRRPSGAEAPAGGRWARRRHPWD